MLLMPGSSVVKKYFMAVTGQIMILFILIHMIGNSMIYFHRLSSYVNHLYDLFLILWTIRAVMFTAALIHIVIGISLYLENRSAKPDFYAVKNHKRATFASKNMLWTGLLTGGFLIFHVLHFTLQVIDPSLSAKMHINAMGIPDVRNMVIMSFRTAFLPLLYLTSLIALSLHLAHGIQSSFQSLGMSNDRTLPVITKAGTLATVIFFAVYAAIPLFVFLGIVKG